MNAKEPTVEQIKMALETFAEAVIESVTGSQDHELEAFESYEMCLRGAIHNNSDQFKSRFVRGYFELARDEE